MRSRRGGMVGHWSQMDAETRLAVIRMLFVEDKRAELPEGPRINGRVARVRKKGHRIMQMLPNRQYFPYGWG